VSGFHETMTMYSLLNVYRVVLRQQCGKMI